MIYDSVVTIQQHDQLPQFSLLMSVYANDSLPQVERAIASATVEQSLPPTQIVIIRDGRVPDDIARFLQGLPDTVADWFSRSGVSLRPRPEVTVVPLEVNQGLAHALNEGLRRCRYDVVARADSDDISLPERFATMMPLFAADRAPAIDIAGSAIQEFSGEENRNGQVRTLPREGAELERFARMQSPLHHPSVVFRKSVVLADGGYPEHVGRFEDYMLWEQLMLRHARFYNVPEALVLYRVDAGAYQRRGGLGMFRDELQLQLKFLHDGFVNLPQFLRNVLVRAVYRLLPTGFRKSCYHLLVAVRNRLTGDRK